MVERLCRAALLVFALGAVSATTACTISSGGYPPGSDDASSEASSTFEGGSDATNDTTTDAISDATSDRKTDSPSEASSCPSGQASCSGACVNPKTDPLNCGSCANKCTSGDVCSNGQCSLSCGGGTTQCGSSCIDTNVDPNNCGGCGHACPTGQLCSAGQCATQCGGGLSMCPGPGGDGGGTPLCVDEQNDQDHCGGCGTVCPTGNACSGGKCSVACPGTEVNCSGLCIDPSSDDQYCGATGACGAGDAGKSGTQCQAGQVCNNGNCSVSCPGNEINCGGKCVDPSTDQHHCGATAGCGTGDAGTAGVQCPSGQVCNGGACSVSCPGNEINCNGSCVDPTTSNAHCGATAGCGTGGMGSAGSACPSGEVCNSGTCSVSCPGSEVNCNGTCVDPSTSNQHCGVGAGCAGGTSCPSGQVCSGGSCSVSCPGTEINCNGGCVDPSTSNQHCGATSGCGNGSGSAGVTCPAGQVCGNGQCSVSCPGNEINCGGTCIDPTASNQYCGATAGCGVNGQGSAGQNCTSKAEVCTPNGCAVTCPGNEINCNGTCVDPTSNNQYCGATAGCGVGGTGSAGTNCLALGEVCNASTCAVACPGNEINCGGTCIDPNTSDVHCGATAGCGTGGTGSGGTNCQASGEVCNGAGGCAVSCPSSEVNCGGTCIDPGSNTQHCGATLGCGLGGVGSAGAVCAVGGVCAGSVCGCPGNQVVCNGTCIDPTTNNTNCGATTGCGVGGVGSAGQNCTKSGEVCTANGCSVTCPSGEINCGGQCINPQTSNQYCGATAGCGVGGAGSAGQNCTTLGEVCTPMGCQVTCPGTEVNCGGSCIDPTTSGTHCGATAGCGVSGGSAGINCQMSGAVCNNGMGCTLDCPGTEINCGGACIDPNSNTQYCGATAGCGVGGAGSAGAACATGGICNGTCSCPSSETACGAAPGVCTNTSTDPNNCGTCSHVCGPYANASAACGGGACGFVCKSGFANCNGSTTGCPVSTNTDVNNCGACFHVCSLPNATAGCAGGQCDIAACNAGDFDCDGNPANGCEVNVKSNASNCGGCNIVCPTATPYCDQGTCVACNVTSTADSGTGSLRDLAALCSGTTITFDPSLVGQTITVLSPIPIGNNTTLQGPGASSLTISGGGSTQILNASGNATVSGLTITQGATTAYGGAIHAAGTLTVTGCVFSANKGLNMSLGGAIDASAVAITGSTFNGNSAYYAGALHITNNNGSSSSSISGSTFVSNAGNGTLAGAILNYTNLTITGTTFSGNNASSGQDLMTYGATTITNSTFAGPVGGNIAVYNNVNVSIIGSTLSAASISNLGSGTVQLTNSIVYSLISGTFTSGGYNLINSTSGGTFTPATSDQVGVTPPLDALGNYGGPTQTLMPTLGTNPAIGAIPQANCPLTSDQRGQPRPSSLHPGFCDIGAVERQSGDSAYP